MTPNVVKLLTVALAGALYVGAAFVQDETIKIALCSLASGLGGWQLLRRTGDAPRSVHPDDMKL